MLVEKMLRYCDEEETTLSMKMKKIKGCWEENEEEGKIIRKVQRFSEKVE